MPALRGVVRGRTIELEGEPGLPDGQPVSVIVQRLFPAGEGIKQSAGTWADGGDNLDRWLDQMQQSREEDRLEAVQ